MKEALRRVDEAEHEASTSMHGDFKLRNEHHAALSRAEEAEARLDAIQGKRATTNLSLSVSHGASRVNR